MNLNFLGFANQRQKPAFYSGLVDIPFRHLPVA
jgi:hypothetical protein